MQACRVIAASLAYLVTSGGLAFAQDHPSDPQSDDHSREIVKDAADSADLAKKLNNPISDLISVPFQSNFDCCLGTNDASAWLTNIQPVVPFSLTENWNFIVRTIIPVIKVQPVSVELPSSIPLATPTTVTAPVKSNVELGDILQEDFFSPKSPTSNGIIWGIGPALQVPSGTGGFSNNRYSAGPTAVALKQEGGWTYGVLTYQIWSYGKTGPGPAVSQFFVQPFLVFTTHSAFSVVLNTETTYDWKSKQWTVPINLNFSQVFKVAGQPISFEVGPRYFASVPSQGPRWGARFSLTFLFPE